MSHNQTKHLFLGLPESGKTTFLAALWYYLTHGEENAELSVEVLPNDRTYLNSISGIWLKGEKQTHTTGSSIIDVTLSLHNRTTQSTASLHIPDLSGELFTHHWSDRMWSDSFNSLASNANGVLLFLHPNHNYIGLLISEINAGEAELDGDAGQHSNQIETDSEEHATTVAEFDPEKVPSQTILVDQLQCLLGHPCHHDRLSLSVIISAWDEMTDSQMAPMEWIREYVPFLHQFLMANHKRITVRAFGISAQGGDYDIKVEKDKLLLLPNPTDRILVHDGQTTTNDISAPIKWMM